MSYWLNRPIRTLDDLNNKYYGHVPTPTDTLTLTYCGDYLKFALSPSSGPGRLTAYIDLAPPEEGGAVTNISHIRCRGYYTEYELDESDPGWYRELDYALRQLRWDEELHRTMDATLAYYDTNAADYAARTLPVDISAIRNDFASRLPPGGRILDLGCGSGRDSLAFLQMGFQVDAVDGSAEMCRLASEFTGLTVEQLDFRDLDRPAYYDGIWACASLLHCPYRVLNHEVVPRIAAALKFGGLCYASFKEGSFEGIRDGRWYTDMSFLRLAALPDPEYLVVDAQWRSTDSLDRPIGWLNAYWRSFLFPVPDEATE